MKLLVLLSDNNFTWQGIPGGLILIAFGIVSIYWIYKKPDTVKSSPAKGWLVAICALVAGALLLYKSIGWLLHK